MFDEFNFDLYVEDLYDQLNELNELIYLAAIESRFDDVYYLEEERDNLLESIRELNC